MSDFTFREISQGIFKLNDRNRKFKWLGDKSYEPVLDPLNTFVGAIVRFISRATKPIVQLTANFTPIQSGTGDPSPENIRPISGHTGCEIFDKAEYDPTAQPTVTVNFGQTVYGGKLTVNEDGTGSVVSNRGIIDLGDCGWKKAANGKYFYTEGLASAIKPIESTETVANLLCEQYLKTSRNQIETVDYGISQATNGNVQVRDKDKTELTFSQFKTSMSGIHLVYELATPITIPLTPGQIQTLVGTNTVWVNNATGDITVQAYGTAIT